MSLLERQESDLRADVIALIDLEAHLLDRQRWQDWLSLYCEDCVFWVPAFTMEGDYTDDPQGELNLVYLSGRAGLEERVYRLDTDLSLASTPLPRTRHFVTNIMIEKVDRDEIHAVANAQTAWFTELRGQQQRAATYEYILRQTGEGLRIRQKKILLLESVIDGYFDFYGI